MAKKKNRKAQKDEPAARWSDEAVISLLSWLDFSLKHKGIDFKSGITVHLKGVFTLQQIEGKLSRLWKDWGPDGPPNLKSDLKTRGSLAIPKYLSANKRNDLRLAIEELEKEYGPFLTPSRRLRSTSRLDTPSLNQSPRSNTTTVKKTETPQKRKRRFVSESVTPSGVKNETRQFDASFSKTAKGRKRQKTYSKRGQNRYIHSLSRIPSSPPILLTQVPDLHEKDRRSSTLVRDSDGDVSDTADERPDVHRPIHEISTPLSRLETSHFDNLILEDSRKDELCRDKPIRCVCEVTEVVPDSGKGMIECNQCKVWQHTECAKYLCHQCSGCAQQKAAEPVTRHIGSQTNFSTETDEASDPRLQSAIIRIEELQESLVDREKELQESLKVVKELNRDIHQLDIARKQRDEQYGGPIEEQMVKQQKQVYDLRNELQARQRLGTFTILSRSSRHQGAATEIKSGFEDTYNNSSQIFQCLDIDVFPFIPQLDQNESLLGLTERLCGLRTNGFITSKEELSKFDPTVLLRALTTAALQEWVFESDFPKFDSESSITLAVYRNLLANQDGSLVLRNLDLAALESLIKKPSFEASILPKEARRLAIRLSQTLAPFFARTPLSSDELSWDCFAKWNDTTEAWKERQETLVKMFTDALMTKANSCLNIEDYEMVIYAPGTKFDSKTMKVETMEGVEDTFNDHEGRLVQICVQAAVFAYARSPVSSEASVLDSIIPTKNFVTRTECQRGGSIPRVKAVVVLANTD